MNANNFSRYLQDNGSLHQLPYEELKTLALQYGYCQPLQRLLLRKSLLDNHKDWSANLARAAAVTCDRSLLYHEVLHNTNEAERADTFLLSGDYLELQSLEEEEAVLDLPETPQEEASSGSALELDFSPGASANPILPPLNADIDGAPQGPALPNDKEAVDQVEAWKSKELAELEKSLEGGQPNSPPAVEHPELGAIDSDEPAGHPDWENTINVAIAIAGLIAGEQAGSAGATAPLPDDQRMAPNVPLHQGKPAPRPKSSFTSWVAQFQPPDIQTQLSDIMESKKLEEQRKRKKKARKKAAKGQEVDQIVLNSITERGDIASETLAKVLAKQGQHEKATEMYKRLMLLFPEKSDYFAQQIENLKSK